MDLVLVYPVLFFFLLVVPEPLCTHGRLLLSVPLHVSCMVLFNKVAFIFLLYLTLFSFFLLKGKNRACSVPLGLDPLKNATFLVPRPGNTFQSVSWYLEHIGCSGSTCLVSLALHQNFHLSCLRSCLLFIHVCRDHLA